MNMGNVPRVPFDSPVIPAERSERRNLSGSLRASLALLGTVPISMHWR